MSARFDLTAAVPPPGELGAVHLIGVGGVGVSAVARVMLARGLRVSGSDAKDVPVLAALRAAGARIGTGFDPARLAGVDTVVAGSAIREDNPELRAAHDLGLRVLHRSQGLQSVMLGRRVVAVAGTHGKTTTTSMLAVVLTTAGWDPSFAIGGELTGAGTNARDGAGGVFVAEADESDSSFLVYTPDVAVVTNVAADHLDHHGTLQALEAAFTAFVDRIVPGGVLVACADDPGSAALARARAAGGGAVVTYGAHPGAGVVLDGVRPTGGGAACTLRHDGWGGNPPGSVDVALRVPGWHNALDAAAAFSAALVLGLAPDDAAAGLASYTGTRRRFEPRGTAGGVRVYDDYAHNPAKVAAAVATGRGVAGAGRLCVVFQPHLYSRTATFAADFGAALSDADEVVVMDVYAAREDPVAGVTGALVAAAVALPGDRVAWVPRWDDAAAAAAGRVGPGDVVLTIGAGDVTEVAGHVLALLGADSADGAPGG